MNLTVTRTARDEAQDWLTGHLLLPDGTLLYTVERLSLSIPTGTFPLWITPSGRVQEGTLWSPRPPLLPLIVVPGRSGIRIHAGNSSRDVVGCIAIGYHPGAPGWVRESRRALTLLMEKLGSTTHILEVTEV